MMDLAIIDSEGKPQEKCPDVLLCVNPTELGIEVIKVLKYELKPTDYLLDGEVREPEGEEPTLIRQPIALFAHSYLKRVFSDSKARLEYERLSVWDPKAGAEVQVHQPSIGRAESPRKHEIRFFHWDAVRRRELRMSMKEDIDEYGRQWHENWEKNFERYFLDENGNEIFDNPYLLFTVPTAKILTYYFANVRARVPDGPSETEKLLEEREQGFIDWCHNGKRYGPKTCSLSDAEKFMRTKPFGVVANEVSNQLFWRERGILKEVPLNPRAKRTRRMMCFAMWKYGEDVKHEAFLNHINYCGDPDHRRVLIRKHKEALVDDLGEERVKLIVDLSLEGRFRFKTGWSFLWIREDREAEKSKWLYN